MWYFYVSSKALHTKVRIVWGSLLIESAESYKSIFFLLRGTEEAGRFWCAFHLEEDSVTAGVVVGLSAVSGRKCK